MGKVTLAATSHRASAPEADPVPDVTIVDCGIGNIRSVQRMFEAVEGTAKIVTTPDAIRGARKVVLPGVGAFDAGMRALRDGGWIEALNEAALERRIPILGICLGMQLLCRRSEEGSAAGLGWIAADVVRIDPGDQTHLKLPHMGWTLTRPTKANPIIPLDGPDQRYYYVHKYRAVCDRAEDVLATALYGTEFTSAAHRDNIYGVQFHPEKSHRYGMGLMRRFLTLPC